MMQVKVPMVATALPGRHPGGELAGAVPYLQRYIKP
jgi:hypothetical protein